MNEGWYIAAPHYDPRTQERKYAYGYITYLKDQTSEWHFEEPRHIKWLEDESFRGGFIIRFRLCNAIEIAHLKLKGLI